MLKVYLHDTLRDTKEKKKLRLEKLDPKVVWSSSSYWCLQRQKWMDSFWTRKEESCHCHLIYAVSDATIWTWGWDINLNPRTGLDILFPDGASPAVDSAPKGPGISARPIHHSRIRPLLPGVEAPVGSTCPCVFTLWLKQGSPPPPHPRRPLHPLLLSWEVRGHLRVSDNFACSETLF